MRLYEIITTFLQISDLFNDSTFLGNQSQDQSQDQGTELGNRLDLENSGIVTRSSDETHSRNEQHENYREGRSAKQSSTPLDKMPDADSRHPYSAYTPEKNKISVHRKREERIEKAKSKFNKLKNKSSKGSNVSETTLKNIQKSCKEIRSIKFRVQKSQDRTRQDKKSTNDNLRQGRVENETEALERVKSLNNELMDIAIQKKHVADLLKDCEKVERRVKKIIDSQRPPTLNPQETLILKKVEELSVKLNEKMKEIKKRCGEIGLSGTDNKTNDNKLSRLESEKNDIRFEMIKAQNSIVLLLQQGKISPFIANKYLKEYDKLIINSGNVRNERDASER